MSGPADILWPLVVTAGLGAMLGALDHCSGAQTPPIAQIDEAAMFAAALSACVPTQTSRAATDACREQVERIYCGPGGVLSSSSGCTVDGGASQ